STDLVRCDGGYRVLDLPTDSRARLAGRADSHGHRRRLYAVAHVPAPHRFSVLHDRLRALLAARPHLRDLGDARSARRPSRSATQRTTHGRHLPRACAARERLLLATLDRHAARLSVPSTALVAADLA